MSFLALMSEEDLVELSCRIGMAEKPLHFQRFVKVLGDWQTNPTTFTNEIDNFDMHPENSIKVKKNAAKGACSTIFLDKFELKNMQTFFNNDAIF